MFKNLSPTKRINKFSPLLVIILLTLPVILPFFKGGFYNMHDDQQVVRLYQLDQALTSGQFPIRWVKDLGFGYGYPLFNFYPPLVYYLAEIFYLLLSLSYINSIKAVFILGFFASAFFMYLWSKKHFGRLAGILAALFYIYFPYRAVDVYVRGALAESFAFAWLPLIFYLTDKLFQTREKKYLLLNSLSLAALMLTHNLIFLPFFPLYLLYLLAKLLNVKNKKQLALYSALSIAISFGLSAFFWLPALMEKQFTLVNQVLLAELYTYKLHFVYPDQLWNSIWGFGGSTAGRLDGMSFKIGKLHLILSLIAFLFALLTQLAKSKPIAQLKSIIKKFSTPQLSLIFTTIFLLVVSVFMMIPASEFIWEIIPPLQYLQFPWRFLTFTGLFTSFLAASIIFFLQQLNWQRYLTPAVFILLVFLLFLPNFKLFKPQQHLEVTDSSYTNDEFIKWKISKTSFEFIPKDVKTRINPDLDITEIALDKNQIASQRVQPLSPDQGRFQILTDKSHLVEINANLLKSSQITFNIFNFPGWQARLNNKPIPISDNNDLNLIQLNLPQGNHYLTLRFTKTTNRTIGELITISSLIFIFTYSLIFKFSQTKHIVVKKE